MVCRNPKVEFGAFIDDLQVACSGRASEVVQTLKQAVGDLESFVLDDLGADIAYDKAAITATNKGLADSLRSALGRWAGKSSTHAVNLGIDDTSGRGRHQLENTKRGSRFSAAAKRRRRYTCLTKAVGQRAQNIFVSGLRPAMTYGCEVTGLADAELLTVQRFGALALPPGGAGRSLSAVLALHGDDSFYPAIAPLLQWSKEVWNATTQWGLAGVGMSLPELRRSWQSALGGTNTPEWRS